MSDKFAVIDTETTWDNKVMSIGVAIADTDTFELVKAYYYILLPFKNIGGMYSDSLYINGLKPTAECGRAEALSELCAIFAKYGVKKIFAYNAVFDYGHLSELHHLEWYDIMKIAAYRQYNPKIPSFADCFATGRLRRGYGVENIYRLLSGDYSYRETHNALFDAVDELSIMKMLGLDIQKYEVAKIK